MEKEIWVDIRDYDGIYQISSLGRVRSLDRTIVQKNGISNNLKGVFLKLQKCTSGYNTVPLSKNGVKKWKLVHRLVAVAFIPTESEELDVNHINEIKTDNRIENLEWCTHKKNVNHGTSIERRVRNSNFKGENNPMFGRIGCLNKNSKKISQYSINGEFIKTYASAAEVNRELGYSRSYIHRCANGFKETAYGFLWKYNSDVHF